MKPTYEELLKERDEALAYAERLRTELHSLREALSVAYDNDPSCLGDGYAVDCAPWSIAEEIIHGITVALSEQPPAALAALKAELQAETVWVPAENTEDLIDGEFCVVWVKAPLFDGWKTAVFRYRDSDIEIDGVDKIFVFDEYSYYDHRDVTHYFVPTKPVRTGG